MVDDATRTALKIALQAAVHDRDRANATISFLAEKLGMADATAAVVIGSGDHDPESETAHDVGPVHVSDGEFYGMSQPKAAVAYLERAGRTRPQRTEAILAGLRKGGVEFGGKDPAATFYTILRRNPAFHKVGKSTWGLSAWYPASRRPTKADTGASADDVALESESNDDPYGEEAQTEVE